MATATGTAAGGGPNGQQQPEQQQQGPSILRLLVIFAVIQFGMSYFLRPGAPPPVEGGDGSAPVVPTPEPVQAPVPVQPPPISTSHLVPAWRDGDRFTLRIYMTEAADNDYSQQSMLHQESDLVFGWVDTNLRNLTIDVTIPEAVQNNGSLFAHICAFKLGVDPNPDSSKYDPRGCVCKTWSMIKHMKKHIDRTRSLLAEADNATEVTPVEELPKDDPIISYWKPELPVHLVHDFTRYPAKLPPDVAPHLVYSGTDGYYLPLLFINDWWTLNEHMPTVNTSTPVLPLRIIYDTMGIWKFRIQSQLTTGFSMHTSMGLAEDGDMEDIKHLLTETNPYVLGGMMLVSMLHMIFDFLAFKNDIAFWKNTKTTEGLSGRTVALNCFFQLVILLYLIDNGTNGMVLLSSGVGLAIEVWKLRKAMKVEISFNKGLPRFRVSDKEPQRNELLAETQRHDAVAMNHLGFILYPMVLGYAAYSLVHARHRSWYSWILSTLTGFVYMFGFILMTPQLYINYKLRSVAHMPWRAMVYKALNTFIDDMFAFVVHMPTMHRLSCFRDDIIFFIYLYQRWAYPVDANRRNEYGVSQVEYEQAHAAGGEPVIPRARRDKRVSAETWALQNAASS